MFGTHLKHCPEFLAGDHTRLRELLHPAKADLNRINTPMLVFLLVILEEAETARDL